MNEDVLDNLMLIPKPTCSWRAFFAELLVDRTVRFNFLWAASSNEYSDANKIFVYIYKPVYLLSSLSLGVCICLYVLCV